MKKIKRIQTRELPQCQTKLKKVNAAIDLAESLRRTRHHYCEDSWYSCPEHEDGCSNDDLDECNCGFYRHNEKVDILISKLKELLI